MYLLNQEVENNLKNWKKKHLRDCTITIPKKVWIIKSKSIFVYKPHYQYSTCIIFLQNNLSHNNLCLCAH